MQIVKTLRADETILTDHELLWRTAAGKGKKENGQVDVVVSLWESGLIARPSGTHQQQKRRSL